MAAKLSLTGNFDTAEAAYDFALDEMMARPGVTASVEAVEGIYRTNYCVTFAKAA